jgi:hypothetical protein
MNDVDAQEPWHNVSRPTLKLKWMTAIL